MVLDDKLDFGQNLRDALEDGDSVIDIDVTPNRPDCFGVIGVARDISALSNSKLKKPKLELSENGRNSDFRRTSSRHDAASAGA